jgi:hypothetical protein
MFEEEEEEEEEDEVDIGWECRSRRIHGHSLSGVCGSTVR